MSGTFTKLQNIWGNISGKKITICPKENAARERRARHLLHPAGSHSTIELNPSRVRVVVFRDDKGIKQPLFDSQINCEQEGEEQASKSLCDMRSIERLEQSTSSSSSSSVPPLSNSSGWAGTTAKNRRAGFIKKPSTDSELLGEMMFGSMPMKTVGNSVKVHYIRSTDQLMLTKMFCAQRRLVHQCSLTDYSDTCPLPGDVSSQTIERSFGSIPKNHSMINNLNRSFSPDSLQQCRSSSLSVPILRPGSSMSSLSTHSSPHTHSPPSPLHSLTVTGSVSSSLSRRIQRSRATSLENGSELYRKVLKPLDQPQQSSKKRKYSIGVILSLSELNEPDIQHFQSFLFSHFTLIDAHLEKLKACVIEGSHCKGPVFTQTLTKAYQDFLKDFLSLYRAPRIEAPVWLSLVSRADRRREVCTQFMEEFGSCIVEMETKERKFFLSSLLTAVLSHHLAWVFTVSRQTGDSRFNKMLPKSLGVLAESHPYNPLWAQLGDLFGAVSTPLKLSRTIVTGKNSANVCRLLYILTYFIRCSEVEPWKNQETSLCPPTERKSSTKRTSKIPVPFQGSHDMPHDLSPGEVHNLFNEGEVFESRASSVTVISENDPHSFITPFASPVNVGRDTPIIKPHPFSIRGITHQLSTGSGSEMESFESVGNRSAGGTLGSGSRSPRKSSSFSSRSSDTGSQQLHSSLKRNTPSSVARQPGSMATVGKVTSSETTTPNLVDSEPRCDCHYGNPNCCAFLASCESMGRCPLPDGYVTFDPTKVNYRDPALQSSSMNISSDSLTSSHLTEGCCNGNCQNACSSDYPLHQLASMRMLGPCQEHTLLCKIQTQQHNSSSSVDSGYDRSFTASSRTDCSKDSGVTMATGLSDSLFTNSERDLSMPNSSWNPAELQSITESIHTSRPRSGAISFASRKAAANSGYSQSSSNCPLDTYTRSPDIPEFSSPTSDLPSPTQPLIPTKISTLLENGENYVDTILSRERTPQAIGENRETVECFTSYKPNTAGSPSCSLGQSGDQMLKDRISSKGFNVPSSHVPILKVQQPSLALEENAYPQDTIEHCPNTSRYHRDTTQDTIEHCHNTSTYHRDTTQDTIENCPNTSRYHRDTTQDTIEHCPNTSRYHRDTTQDTSPVSNGSPGRSLQRQAALLSESDSTTLDETEYDKESSFHPENRSIPLSGVPQVFEDDLARDRSYSGSFASSALSMLSEGDSRRERSSSGPFQSDTLSMLSEGDSGRGTKSWVGNEFSQRDVETSSMLSQSALSQISELYDSEFDESFSHTSGFGDDTNSRTCDMDGGRCSTEHAQGRDGAVLHQLSAHGEGSGGIDVETSFSADTLRKFRQNPSLLQEQLQEYDQTLNEYGQPLTLNQFSDFDAVPLPNVNDFHLDLPSEGYHDDHEHRRQNLSDFGHSLFVGHSPTYLSDFVLHGTSQPTDQLFHDKLVHDLTSAVKHSIIDEPIEHGVAIVADTDTWTVKVVAASKSLQTNDVILGSTNMQPSRCIKQLLNTVRSMYEMRLPAEFCLSHVEDRLLELNERSITLVNTLMDYGSDTDFGEILPKTFDILGVHDNNDRTLLLVLAGVNCPDPDIRARLNHIHMTRLLGKQYF